MLKLKANNDTTTHNTLENYNVVNLKGIRRHNLPYIFIWVVYYAWVIAFATWWTTSPLTDNTFSTELRSLIHSVNLISSGILIFFIRKEWFVKIARIGSVMVVVGMSLFLIVPNASATQFSAVAIGICLGCVNIGILIPFVFYLNNTEKMYAIVGSNVLINLILLFQGSSAINNFKNSKEPLLSFFVLLISLSATLFFKRNSMLYDSENNNTDKRGINPRVYLTLVFNCAFVILCKGVGSGILNISAGNFGNSIFMWYYIGGFVGCISYISIYAFSRKSFIWIGNITFAFVAMGLLCNAFTVQVPGLSTAFAVLLGVGSTIGMINMYYIVGVVGKKYNSMRYLRLSIVFIGICGGVSAVVVGNLIHSINNFEISVISSIVSVAFMLLFLMLSPVVAQTHYYDDWAKDSENMEIDNEQLYIFNKYQLSKREIEVCKLLLKGYTLRQTSALLSISYSTVNTYCTALYRKLKINSRTELLVLFKEYTIK